MFAAAGGGNPCWGPSNAINIQVNITNMDVSS
jgi:hypothetical protein